MLFQTRKIKYSLSLPDKTCFHGAFITNPFVSLPFIFFFFQMFMFNSNHIWLRGMLWKGGEKSNSSEWIYRCNYISLQMKSLKQKFELITIKVLSCPSIRSATLPVPKGHTSSFCLFLPPEPKAAPYIPGFLYVT